MIVLLRKTVLNVIIVRKRQSGLFQTKKNKNYS